MLLCVDCNLQCKWTLELTTLIHHFTSHFFITLSLYLPLTLSLSPSDLSVPLCHSVAGIGGLGVLIGFGLMLSDWWETCDSQMKSWPCYTQPPTKHIYINVQTHLQYVDTKHIHTNEHTLHHALMHKGKCMYTHLNGCHTNTHTPTQKHTHPWEFLLTPSICHS